MRLDAPSLALAVSAQLYELVRDIQYRSSALPSQRKVRRTDDLDKIHVVERLLLRTLLGIIKRI